MHKYPSELHNGINNPNFNDINRSIRFLGVYIIMPIALIVRDQLIIIYIEKCILTPKFWAFIHELTIEKAYYNVIYTKKYEVRAPEGFEHIEEKRTYFIDDVEVSLKTFNDFLSNQKNYVDKIAKKNLRH